MVQPYRLIDAWTKSCMNRELLPILDDWSSEWIVGETTAVVDDVIALHEYHCTASPVVIKQWVTWHEDNWCALLDYEHTDSRSDQSSSGTGKPSCFTDDTLGESSLIEDVLEQSLLELTQRLVAGADADYAAVSTHTNIERLPAGAFKPGSGAVALRLKVGTTHLCFVLSQQTISRYVDPKPERESLPGEELVLLKKALHQQNINVSVRLGTAELALHELASFEVGDVVTLDSCIDKPCSLLVEGLATNYQGYFGKQQDQLAFRLAGIISKHEDE